MAKEGYKVTELGLIPEDWKVSNLVDVSNITMGQSPDSNNYNIEGNGLFLIQGNADIKDRKTNPRNFTSQITKICEVGDIIMSVRAPVGEIAISLHKACIGRGICSIKANNINNDFLYQYMLFSEIKWDQYKQGSTFESVNSNHIKAFKIIVPSSLEQQKIAYILSTWDGAIEKTEKLIDLKNKQKKALMQQLLTGKKRFKEFIKSDKFVQTEIGLIPEDWSIIKLNTIFDRLTKKNSENNLNSLTISAKYGLINQLEFFNKSISAKDLSGYYLLEKGDFAYNKSYSNGYPMGVIKSLEKYDKGVVSNLYICFRIKQHDADAEFYLQYFESGNFNSEITKVAKEGGRAHGLLNVGVNEFFNLHIPYPSLQEQQKIASVLSTCNNEIKLLKKKLEVLKLQKKGLMQKLLMGQIRVNTNISKDVNYIEVNKLNKEGIQLTKVGK